MSEPLQHHTPEGETDLAAIPSFEEYTAEFGDEQKERLGKMIELCLGINPQEISGAEMWEHLRRDKAIIRSKYDLPENSKTIKTNGQEYFSQLIQKAKELQVDVRHPHEFERFFLEHTNASAVFIDDSDSAGVQSTIATKSLDSFHWEEAEQFALPNDTPEQTKVRYLQWVVKNLEHEVIHALQHDRYPRMNLARREYEAYLASANMSFLKSQPWYFFQLALGSVNYRDNTLEKMWQEYQSEKSAEVPGE